MTTTIVARQLLAAPAREDEGAHAPGGAKEVCAACGAVKDVNEGVPYLRREDARFCPTCWRRLTLVQIEQVIRVVALRGVPLS
jgi:uncharacterized protein YbaR (Trm112 family)